MRPYYERILSENVSLRGFSEQIDPDRLTWHRDEENRIIIVVEGNGWMFQRDNEIPILMEAGDRIKVNAGEYHRVIKGDDDLIVTIIKEKKKTKKKKQDKKLGMRSVKSGADSNPRVSKTDFLPQSVLNKMAKEREEDIDEKRKRKKRRKKRKKRSTKKKSGGLTRGYKANRTPASQSRLSSLTKQYRDADTKAEKMAAIRARDAFEKSQYKSKKKSKHNYKRKKKEE
tara:strand:- start:1396 stop:2079 length:684 start_codon:yes stop_codon:yes gene_type:complete